METKGWQHIFEKAANTGTPLELEKAAVDHPMDSDALEGLEAYNITPDELDALQQRLDVKINPGSGAQGLSGFNTLLLMLGMGLAASLAFAWWNENDAVEHYAESNPVPFRLESEGFYSPSKKNKPALVVTPAILETTPTDESSREMNPGPALEIAEEVNREIWHLEPMPSRESGELYVAPRKERLWREAPDYRYEYLHNYKIFDYGKRNIPADKDWMIGLEPGYSHWKFTDEDITAGDHYVPYLNVLEKAILAFDKEDYEKSLQHLKSILRAVPEDQNGLFYSAMSHYQLGEYSASEKIFRQLLEDESDVFRPEATWYLALNLLAQNKSFEAKDYLKSIQARNGFYSNRAEEQLSEME